LISGFRPLASISEDHGSATGGPKKEEYLKMLEDYKKDLEEELKEVEKEIDELEKEG